MYTISGTALTTEKLLDAAEATGVQDVATHDPDITVPRVLQAGRGFYHSVQLAKSDAAATFSVTIEGSNDGLTWTTLATITTTALTQITGVCKFIRANVGALSAGSLTAIYRGS